MRNRDHHSITFVPQEHQGFNTLKFHHCYKMNKRISLIYFAGPAPVNVAGSLLTSEVGARQRNPFPPLFRNHSINN
ncbi:hypothetical protein TorRG33x02_010390 [Trema orientale]|uniref:Uncharacterized protein n=1 Tax=Trema orientale TaxID=63057 RepID=A0A2P5FYV8_TREOI|nr:hypothetical protein TorRG33x02_010390 [Trema orientale]